MLLKEQYWLLVQVRGYLFLDTKDPKHWTHYVQLGSTEKCIHLNLNRNYLL